MRSLVVLVILSFQVSVTFGAETGVKAEEGAVAIGGNVINSTINVGTCNPIINVDFQNRDVAIEAIRKLSPETPADSVELVVRLLGCGQLVTDPKRRFELLIFALDEMLFLKEQFYIPALDRFIDSPTQQNFELMVRIGNLNVRKIEEAIDQLVQYEASVQPSAAGDVYVDRVARSRETLQRLSNDLSTKLSQRLGQKLQSPLSLVPQDQMANQAQIHGAMISYRNNYVNIVEDIRQIVGQMRAEANQPQQGPAK